MRTSGRELEMVKIGHGPLHVQDQRLDVGRARSAVIDDEVGVLQGHRGIADSKPFKPALSISRAACCPAGW